VFLTIQSSESNQEASCREAAIDEASPDLTAPLVLTVVLVIIETGAMSIIFV
jgi:hypothetical protein